MTRGARAARPAKARGFTLVELGAVIAIVGILAVVAVIAYRKYILHAKITEAQNGISAIKIAQEDYRAERGTYADIGATYCPNGGAKHDLKVGWDPECSGGGSLTVNKWKSLPVHMSGAVRFQYATVAGTATYAAPTDAKWVTVATAPTGPWFVVMAKCDLDGAGDPNTQLVGLSFSNEIFMRNDGN